MGLRANKWFEKIQKRRRIMKLKIVHDYTIRDVDKEGDKWLADSRNVTEFLIIAAINKKYGQEVKDRLTQRKLGRIRNALTKAVKEKSDFVELTEEQFEFLWSDVVKDHAPNPHHAGWWCDLYDHFEETWDQLKKAPKPA